MARNRLNDPTDVPVCGEPRGYLAHLYRDEIPCSECCDAWYRWTLTAPSTVHRSNNVGKQRMRTTDDKPD